MSSLYPPLGLHPSRAARRWRPSAWLLLALLATLLLTSQLGAVQIAAADWLAGPWSGEAGSAGAHVLWQLRLPRLLLAAAAGAALGLAGALSQALFRNPMADPALLGVTSGAAAAVALSLTVFAGLQLALPAEWRLWLLPMVGFAGALSVCFGLERLARWLAPGSIAALLLSGLAIQALAFAVVGLCSHLASDEQLRSLSFWTLGSVAGANWTMFVITALALLGIAGLARRLAPQLNALALGESAAGHVGVNVQRLRGIAIACVALLSALCVAWCGSIGFIGLMAPHLARQWVGADQRQLMPCAMLVGALLLLLADTLARTLAVPAEIPVGIFTALIGAPWFLLLLRGSVRRMGSA
ncbi:iron complex transport system permease protein [Paucibacter oligotrophus]|uniref:Iron complex transport system permease protein n=1 Tax=Roseateles oligotrophus TaxID=1769250 RepID=A0A840L7Z0_9BURK|nr:iron ABC transporter permease [Roseateles oligotrophus]MBB4844186.1 iron complex transport system permease protein [Roseateles oligotrophus]